MSFKQEVLDHYMDKDLLVTIDRDPTPWSTGNGLLYTGLFYTLLTLRNELTKEDCERFEKAVRGCEVDGYHGLYHRNPGRTTDLEAHDDYIGIAAGSFFTNTPMAREIWTYGDCNSWCFNNLDPGKKSPNVWQGRFIGIVCFYTMAAKEDPSFFQKLLFNSAIRGSIDSNNVSGKILAWLQVQVAKKANVCPKACELFEQSIVDDFGGITGLLSQYFPAGHPFGQVTI